MVTEASIPLKIAPGFFSEQTPRNAGNFYKDGNLARFRNDLPEKLGGWRLQSNGTTNGYPYGVTSLGKATGLVYGAGAATIPSVSPVITAAIGQKFWIFDDSKTGGLGTLTIGSTLGLYLATTSAPVVAAAAGDAVFINYGEGNGGAGYALSGGTATGSTTLTTSTIGGFTTFLLDGSLCVIPLQAGGEHVTTIRGTIISGATSLVLAAPLPSPALTVSPVIRVYAPETVFRPTNAQGVVLKFLAHAVAASTQLIFTTALTHTALARQIDIRTYQEFAVDITHTSTSTLTLPALTVTAFAIASVATWPDGAILQLGLFQNQVTYDGVCRATHDWADLTSQELMAFGTECKLYLVNSNTLTDITPIRETGTLANNPFSTTALSRSVGVVDTGHQQVVGNFVTFSGATAVGGITISGQYQVTTIVDSANYTITAAYPALTTVAAGGGAAVAYSYDIDCGLELTTELRGWGTGAYGAGPWGVGDGLAGVEVPLRVWSLDNFGEDLLASPSGGSLYWYDRSAGSGTRAVLVTTAPATIERMIVSTQARHVIALGADLGSATTPGDPDPLLIRWSSQENFAEWASTDANSAGDLRLDIGSKIVSAKESRGDTLVHTDESLHALQYIGSPLFFSLRHLGQSLSIAGANAAVDVNGRVFYMTLDVFMVYDGVIQVLESPIESFVFDDLNRDQGAQIYVGHNKLFTEIFYFYPSLGSTVIDRYAKYNYTDNAWDYGDLARTAWADSSSFYGQLPYGFNNGVIFSHENNRDGQDENGLAIPMSSYVETYDMEIDQGYTLFHIKRMVPDFKTLEGSVSLTLNGRTYPQGAQKSKGPFTVTSATTKVDLRMRSKQISFKVASSALGDYWRFSDWRAEGVPHGRRGGQ
jgi:hypothetical protein